MNGNLDGIGGTNNVPTGWQQFPYTDPASNASSVNQATSDLTWTGGPSVAGGIVGNPFVGNTFTCALHASYVTNSWLWREGIMQSVSGFIPGNTYEIEFHQAVVKQSNCLDQSGSWSVYADNVLLQVTPVTTSTAPFNSVSFAWEYRSVSFVATSTTHVIKFFATDDDNQISIIGNYGLRMGIDGISVTPVANTLPQVNLGSDTTLCQGDPLILDVTCLGCSYEWQDGSTLPNFTATSAGTYSVEVTNQTGAVSDTINVSFINAPILDLGVDTTLCGNSTLMLDASQLTPVNYLWQDGSINSTFNVTQAGQYSVTVDNMLGCSSTDVINVTYETMPQVSLSVTDTTLCTGSFIFAMYSGSNIGQVLWSDGSTAPFLITTNSTQYWIDVSNECGVDSDTLNVNFVDYPVIDLGVDTMLCDNSTLMLDASQSTPANYLWQDGSVNSTFNVTQAGQYSVTVDNMGCSSTGAINVTYEVTPQISLSVTDTTLCTGSVINITYSGSNIGQVLWSDGSTAPSLTTTTSSQYWIDVSSGCGDDSDTLTVSFMDYPVIDLGVDTMLCDNSTLMLDASQSTPANYLWQDGSVNSTFNVTQAGQYSVTVDNMGCSSTDVINVIYEATPQISLSVTDTTLCAGSVINVAYSGSNIGQVLWSDGSTGPSLTTTTSNQYWIDASNICGDDSDTLNVNFVDYPVIDLGVDTTLCDNSTLTLDASQSTSVNYLWQDGSVNSTFNVTQAGQYSVTVDNMGCSSTDVIDVIYEATPQISLSVTDTTLCEGSVINVTYSGSNIGQVLWSDGSTAPSLTTTASTQYWIDASNICGDDSDTLTVSFVDYPIVDLGSDTTLCEGSVMVLGGNQLPGVSYLWQNGSTNPTLDVVQPGVYSVVISNSGCVSIDVINVSYISVPEVTLPNDTSVCSNDLYRIDIPAIENGFVEWSTGSTDLFLTVPEAGVYTLEGYNNCGSSTESIEVGFIDCDCSFFIPNSFTPDADKYNNVFVVQYGCEDLQEFNLKIFNRWGEVIFESYEVNEGWDGTYSGLMVQDGVYTYVVNYTNDVNTEVIMGHVNLLR